MTRGELKAYFTWFMDNRDQRVAELHKAISRTVGFQDVILDFTRGSWVKVSEWLSSQIEWRQRSQDELVAIQSQTKHPLFHSDQEVLTERTYSLCIDSAIYLGQSLIRARDDLYWGQVLRHKREHLYGQAVLCGFDHFNREVDIIGVIIGKAGSSRWGIGISGVLSDLFDSFISRQHG